MRVLQAILLLLGNPLLFATVFGTFGVLVGAVVFRPDPGTHGTGAWGSLYGVMLFAALGTILGIVAGIVGAITLISSGDDKPWPRATWIGVGVGIIVCVIGQFVARNTEADNPWKAIFVDQGWGVPISFIVLGTLGGYLGALTTLFGAKSKPARSRPSGEW